MELPRHDDDCDEDFETQFMIHQSLQELFKIDPVEDTLVDESSFVEETPDLSDRRRIVEAIRTGDEQALLKLESPYRTFAHADERGWLLLHEAAIQLDKNILAITLKATFPSMWDDTTLHGETPLFLAVIHCQPQNVDFLLMNGSNPDAKNEDGDSPLIMAIRHGSYEMASLLICAKASVNLRCVNNRTALHEAARLGHKDIVQFLLHAGAEPDAHSNYGLTPLALASQNGYIEIIETLLQKGANILSQATDSASIIFEAAAGGNPDAIALLLDYGADPNVPKQSGHLPIHRAAYRGHLLALKMLIPVTAFAAIKRSGISPIHSAAAGGHPQCLELLIQSNFDVNFMLDQHVRKGYDDQRKSALYFAVANADACSTKLLLDAGALPNQDPVNCLQVALRMANYELVSMLLRHGANVNYFCRVNTLHFPSALQYTLKDEILLRMLLNYGYNVRLCFDCPYGDKEHTPYGFEGWSSPVIKDTLFCEVITLRWLQDLSGTVVRALLDYVDQVEICCKLKKVLIEQPQWPEINAILTNPRALKHLCRLKIRQRMGRLRLRCPVFMTFLPLPQLLKDYVLYKEYNLYEQRILSVSP